MTELGTYCVCSEDVQTFGKQFLEGKIQLISRKSRNSFFFYFSMLITIVSILGKVFDLKLILLCFRIGRKIYTYSLHNHKRSN